MTPTTTQLRILRTPLPSHPTKYALRAPIRPTAAWRRRVQPSLQPRVFSTTPFAARGHLARLKEEQADELSSSSSSSITTTTTPILSPAAANPPATTRPPPLDLPTRAPDTSAFAHLFATGKAYLGFYKAGLKNIYLSWRLLRSLDDTNTTSTTTTTTTTSGEANAPAPGTRSALLLRRRVRHDLRRLAPFALLLLVCGELTPFVVLAVPRLVPSACRIPRQVDALRRQAEARRRASWARLWGVDQHQHQHQQQQHQHQAAPARDRAVAHVARSLGLVSPLWDRLPASCDGLVARAARGRVRRRLALLARDDELLRRAGGAPALEAEEAALACEDRGLLPGRRSSPEEEEEEEEEEGGAGRGADVDEMRGVLDRALFLAEPWRPRGSPAGLAGEDGATAPTLLGTPEMIACVLVSGDGWGETPRGEMRRRAEEYCEAWGGPLV